MMTLRRAQERHHEPHCGGEAWFSFYPKDAADSLANGFGSLETLKEDCLSPGAGVPRHPRQDAEIINYVRNGALTYEDSSGHSGVIQAGEFQHRTAGRKIRYSETNASRTDEAQVFRIWLRPSQTGSEPAYEQKRFSAAERRDKLCLIASPDARRGSLRIHHDALIYSTLLNRGQHVVHELPAQRQAWLHVVCGEASLGDVVLTTGDGVGVMAERALSLTAQEETEILLVDLSGTPPFLRDHLLR